MTMTNAEIRQLREWARRTREAFRAQRESRRALLKRLLGPEPQDGRFGPALPKEPP
jgi:hypothetical protein